MPRPVDGSARENHGHYRPDIDGLRAISILAVVAFHTFPRLLPGGFVGVDIFFVISGVLISGIVFRARQQGTFSYAAFYSRRIKRIFPALFVTLAASLCLGWLFLFKGEWRNLGQHISGGAFFYSNILSMGERGYFDSPSGSNPLLHLWSLGIEEQFYLTWPLFLALTSRWRPLGALPIAVAGCASFAAFVFIARHSANEAFYLPTTRFWELILGSLLAYLTVYHPAAFRSHPQRIAVFSRMLPSLLAALGALLLLGSLRIVGEARFQTGWAILPAAGACILIVAGPGAGFNRYILSAPPLVFIGLIGYPLYLWHWPLSHLYSNGAR